MLNRRFGEIYNSRSYSILLNIGDRSNLVEIYNSRNYSILLNEYVIMRLAGIYNSRNYSILLNIGAAVVDATSTTVEIILYYLTSLQLFLLMQSTTVEIILYYLTSLEP